MTVHVSGEVPLRGVVDAGLRGVVNVGLRGVVNVGLPGVVDAPRASGYWAGGTAHRTAI